MKIIRTLALLILIFALAPSLCHAQQDTVVSVAFMTRDKNLWPDYRANKNSLDRLFAFLKRNPESKVYINVACASHTTTAENLATARERLAAIKSQMAQRFSLEKYLHTSKLSTVPVAGRADIAVIVVKMPRPETPTAPQTQTPTMIAQNPAPGAAQSKDSIATTTAKSESKQEVVIAAAVVKPAQKSEPIVAIQPATPVTTTQEDEDKPIEFTEDEIRTLINQADNFVPVPKFNIQIPDGPHELPQQPKAADTYTNSKNLQPPVKYLKETIAKKEGKKSPRKGK